jgi:hypothetical protein
MNRSGTILIVVAGVAAMLAALAAAFLVTMRSDTEETEALAASAQAHMMLNAGLMYVAETARIGWEPPGASERIEAFGWVDIRDGKPGPRDQLGRLLYTTSDPDKGTGTIYPAVGTSTRCPFHVLVRPPCALSPNTVPNPMPLEPSRPWAELVSMKNPNPVPAIKIPTDWDDFLRGDPRIREDSQARSWFRIHRKTPSVFIITCGAGTTTGYRTYPEASDAGEGELFNNDPEFFAELRRHETILWYETEWNPAVYSSAGYLHDYNAVTIQPIPVSKPFISGTSYMAPRNFAGSFLYIQRLDKEPPNW